jgi:hypothetical protein
MKTFLMHRGRDVDLRRELPWNAAALTQDLALDTLLEGMAGGDDLVREMSRRALLNGCENDADTIRYRQAVVRDAIMNSSGLRELYGLAGEAIANKRQHSYWISSRYPSSALSGAIELMTMYLAMLRRLRALADGRRGDFASEGFATLFAMLERELPDDYLAQIASHLKELRFCDGILVSAQLGPGNAGEKYVLRQRADDGRPWLRKLLEKGPAAYTFQLPERDEAGARALSELRDRGIQYVANALAEATEHVEAFFQMLRVELAFYVGCLNLHERLVALGVPTSFPVPLPTEASKLRCRELCEPSLALQLQRPVVGNSLDTNHRALVVITGANQGGKSSFLRSVGAGQLMLQSGMFVAASLFESSLCPALVTHYKREEDAALTGKFAEELERMSGAIDHLKPGATVLLNESFAATNEREGSEIAGQVVSALIETRHRVFFVTHLHTFARNWAEQGREGTVFLRAERLPDGTRTFRIIPGEPLSTSHGRDLYDRIFATGPAGRDAPNSAGLGTGS